MAFKEWKEQHQALWEFILFNIPSFPALLNVGARLQWGHCIRLRGTRS